MIKTKVKQSVTIRGQENPEILQQADTYETN